MEEDNMIDNIRMAKLEDVPAILSIYEPYILNTAITFEYETPSAEAFQKRMEAVQKQFPWLVYEEEGKVVGYAYCSRFKERAAFDWDCECSVYIAEQAHRKGIATALYNQLFEMVQKLGYYNIYALITYSHGSSVSLHRKFGFNEVGVYKNTGYKMGQWWDLLVMEKRIHSFEETPVKPRTIHEISDLV
jgi:phosphinothricin acetyltransferase